MKKRKKKKRYISEERRLMQGWAFNLAYRLMDDHMLTRSEALKLAYLNRTLLEMLGQGEVRFLYRKGDGTLRVAKGTLRADLIPLKPNQKAMPKKYDDIQTAFVYYDTVTGGFRSFRACSLLRIYGYTEPDDKLKPQQQ